MRFVPPDPVAVHPAGRTNHAPSLRRWDRGVGVSRRRRSVGDRARRNPDRRRPAARRSPSPGALRAHVALSFSLTLSLSLSLSRGGRTTSAGFRRTSARTPTSGRARSRRAPRSRATRSRSSGRSSARRTSTSGAISRPRPPHAPPRANERRLVSSRWPNGAPCVPGVSSAPVAVLRAQQARRKSRVCAVLKSPGRRRLAP